MKDNNIDDLFRQKLGHQKLTPPPTAWAAVEQNLPGKKKKGIYFWMSAAASLLLICTLGWLVLTGEEPIDTPDQTVASTEKQPELINDIEQENSSLVADRDIKPEDTGILNDNIEEPSQTQMLASAPKEQKDIPAFQQRTSGFNTSENVTNESGITREPLMILPIDLPSHISITTMARDFDFDMVMPIVLSDYYIPYTEELELTRKKRKFRVLNGIISIAKEVNSSKLSLSELRNAKNNFVNDDLKYGTKAEGSEDDDSEEEPNKE